MHNDPARGHLSQGVQLAIGSGEHLRVGIVSAKWNRPIIDALITGTASCRVASWAFGPCPPVSVQCTGCTNALLSCGVRQTNIIHDVVPGSYELPFAAKSMILRHARAQVRFASERCSFECWCGAIDLVYFTDAGGCGDLHRRADQRRNHAL